MSKTLAEVVGERAVDDPDRAAYLASDTRVSWGHPAVAIAAAVSMPDETFGERVCVYVELRPGNSLDLEALVSHFASRGVSKEMWPERLVVVPELPRGAGGKVAKQQLREDIARRVSAERHALAEHDAVGTDSSDSVERLH